MLCQNCKSMIPDNSTFCPFCGAENEKDAQYCISCGSDMWNLKQKQISQSGSRKAGTVAIVFVAVAVIVAIGAWIFLHKDTEKKADTPVKETVSTTEKQPEKNTKAKEKDKHRELQSHLQTYIQSSGVNRTISVYYADLNDGQEYAYHSQSMRAGQSGRIFVLEYIVEAVRTGSMQRTAELMNTIKRAAGGDEPASHKLVTLITGDFAQSLDLVSEYVKQQGYTDTVINRFNGDIGNHTSTGPNQTSAHDTGKSIANIYQAAQKGDAFAQEVLDLLSTNASLKKGIAAGAANASVSNLEASYTACENDTAIITRNGHSIALSIMISDLTEDGNEYQKAMENINSITRKVSKALLESNT